MSGRLSVNKINKISREREVWCWGSGFQYGRMIKMHGDEKYVECIKGIIDSNEKIQGSTRSISDRTVKIYSPESLLKDKKKKYLVIITCDAYDEVLYSAKKLYADLDVIYTQYPTTYYEVSAIIKKIFCKIPMKRRLLFYVGSGNSQPHENADEIVRYLKNEYRGKQYDLVYMTDTPCEVRKDVKQISLSHTRNKAKLMDVIRYYYYYCTSRFLLFENSPVGKIRSDQKTIYLNHGTIPLKYVRDALKQPSNLNYAVCPGRGSTKFYVEQYSIDACKLIYLMQPRVRSLFDDKKDAVDHIFNSNGEQLILWLPTFRKLEKGDKSERRDSSVESPLSQLICSERINELNDFLKNSDQKLIIKCHPREKESLVMNEKKSNIFIITDEELNVDGISLHNLMNRADALISDYSGITFEYLFLNRPLGYYIPDINDYTRGFAVDDPLHYMPGEKMYSTDDLLHFFARLKDGEDIYEAQRRDLRRELFDEIDPEKGSEMLIEFFDKLN